MAIIKKLKLVPRGIRNNNPLNIRIGNTWLGERQNPTDREFEEFVSIEYGYRAAMVLLRRYIRHYHLDTIEGIISRWAPRSENDTRAYIETVCRVVNLKPTDRICYDDKPTMCKLVDAMQTVECGCRADIAKVEKGYDMA